MRKIYYFVTCSVLYLFPVFYFKIESIPFVFICLLASSFFSYYFAKEDQSGSIYLFIAHLLSYLLSYLFPLCAYLSFFTLILFFVQLFHEERKFLSLLLPLLFTFLYYLFLH